MASTSQRSPVPSTPWRTFQEEPPPSASGSMGGTLGALAIAVGVGVLGAYMLDLHSHKCCRCGSRWRHFGAFNLGDEPSHTCSRCGVVQWWKCGVPHVLRGSQFVEPPSSSVQLSPPLSPPIDAFAAPVVPPAFALPGIPPSFAPGIPPAFTAPVGALRPSSPPRMLSPSRAPLLAIQARRVPR
jgi:hypothetical protein